MELSLRNRSVLAAASVLLAATLLQGCKSLRQASEPRRAPRPATAAAPSTDTASDGASSGQALAESSPATANTPPDPLAGYSFERDRHSRVSTVVSGETKQANGGGSIFWMWRAFLPHQPYTDGRLAGKTESEQAATLDGATVVQIYCSELLARGKDWPSYNRASVLDHGDVDTVHIDYKSTRYTKTEAYAAMIPLSVLRNAGPAGLSVKFYGRRGKALVEPSSEHVAAILQAIDRERAGLRELFAPAEPAAQDGSEVTADPGAEVKDA